MAEIKHGTEYGYSKQKCRCDDCRAGHNTYKNAYRARNRERRNATQNARNAENRKHKVKPLRAPIAKLVTADRLLRDGASYAETARTVGVDPQTVANWFPGRGWTSQQVVEFARLHSYHNSKKKKR